MRKQVLLAGCLTLALAAATAGCGGKEAADAGATTQAQAETSKEAQEGTTEEEPQMDEEELEELELELYNTYIEINNQMVDRFSDVINSYFEYVDFQEEFTPLQEDYWCLSCISTFYTDMDRANELIAQKAETDPVDEAFLALYPVMKELAESLDAVEAYTDEEAYRGDDYAKGKELHSIIWKDYAEYETLGNEFLDKLDVMVSEQYQENLDNLKAEGLEATYAFNILIDTAQEIQMAIYEQEIDDTQLINLDIEALTPLYDQYLEQVQICLDFLADEDAMQEEGYMSTSAYYLTFKQSIGESGDSLTNLFNRVKNQEPVSDFDLMSMIPGDGTIQEFDSIVSDIIDDYNHLISY